MARAKRWLVLAAAVLVCTGLRLDAQSATVATVQQGLQARHPTWPSAVCSVVVLLSKA